MFIEVYVIPVDKWSGDPNECKIDTNRRLININHIRVRYSRACENRAEIVFQDDTTLHVVGSYEEIVKRIGGVTRVSRV